MDMERVPTGIYGLDEMMGGGFPKGHTIVVMGAYGTGKTTFGLQYIWEGVKRGEKGIYLSLEEDVESVLASAESFGWDFAAHKDRNLFIVRLDPQEAMTSVRQLKDGFVRTLKEIGATRVVVDSITLLAMLFEDEAERRREIFNLARSVKAAGATSVFTAEVDPRNPYVTRDGLAEYVADGVILLRYEETASRDLDLTLRIVKMRRTRHSRKIKPYRITDEGIIVLSEADL